MVGAFFRDFLTVFSVGRDQLETKYIQTTLIIIGRKEEEDLRLECVGVE